MAFMLGKHLVFLYSFQFMASSLERLAGNIPADKFNYTSQAFKGEKLGLMKKNSVCPYDYWTVFRSLAINSYPQKRNFIVFLQTRVSLMRSIRMHRKFEILFI